MNNDHDDVLLCPRCGAEMKSDARYCMKCGNLNYNHKDNASLKKYIKNNKFTYVVGQGNFIKNDSTKKNLIINSLATNTGNKFLCFIINILIFLFIIIMNILPKVNNGEIDFNSLAVSSFPIIIIISSILIIYFYSAELIYMKANKRWWSALVPIYNIMVLADITFDNKYLGLITLIPFIGPIFLLVMFYKLGKQFKYNGFLTAIFFPIMIPIIGFGHNFYRNHNYVKSFNDNNQTIERDYKRKRIFLFILIVFLLFGVGLIIYSNISNIKKTSNLLGNSYYVYASKYIVHSTKLKVAQGLITCNGQNSISDDGDYIIHYNEAGKNLGLLFQLSRESIEAYVRIARKDGVNTYYISLSDGTYGFDETLSSDVKLSTVGEFSKINDNYKNLGVYCTWKLTDKK